MKRTPIVPPTLEPESPRFTQTTWPPKATSFPSTRIDPSTVERGGSTRIDSVQKPPAQTSTVNEEA